MKRKWYFLLLAAAISGTMIVACSDDDNDETDNSLIKSYSSISLGAQDNPTLGGMLSLSNGSVYTLANAFSHQTDIDILCFYEAPSNNMSLASPGSGISGIFMNDTVDVIIDTWTTKDTTQFNITTMTASRFDAVTTPDSIVIQYNPGTARKKAKLLEAGQVYAFKTQDAKYGLFKVISTTGEEAGSITFAVKMQR